VDDIGDPCLDNECSTEFRFSTGRTLGYKPPADVDSKFVSGLCRVSYPKPYEILNFTLESPATENDVIARQKLCPAAIELSEFVEFGTLRTVPHLRVRNVMRAIESRIVRMDQAASVLLFRQALLELGDRQIDVALTVHPDVTEQTYWDEVLKRLSVLCNDYKENWEVNAER
jgi:hypothetical protein